MRPERQEICLNCPSGGQQRALAAQAILSFVEDFVPKNAAEGTLMGDIINQLDQILVKAEPPCEAPSREVVLRDSHFQLCRKISGLILVGGDKGVQRIKF